MRTQRSARARQREALLGGRPQWVTLLIGSALVATLLTPVEQGLTEPGGSGYRLGAMLDRTGRAGRDAGRAVVADVTVPRHRSDLAGLQLLGASTTGFLLRQPGRGINDTGRLLLGVRGSSLRSIIDPGGYQADYDVTGRTFSWADTSPTPQVWQVHRIDLVTGAEHSYRSTDQPVAWTPTGWIGWKAPRLIRHTVGGGQQTLLRGLSSGGHGGPSRPIVLADGEAAVVRASMPADGVAKDRIMLIPLSRPRGQVLASVPHSRGVSDAPAYGLNNQALSDRQVDWVSWTSSGGSQQILHQRDRQTGQETSLVLPTDLDLTTLTAAGDRVAMLRSPGVEGSSQVAVLTGGLWRTVSLPGPTSTLRAAGAEFFAAVDGPPATAGVYAIGDGGPHRVATVPSRPVGVTAVSLSAGRLSYLDAAVQNGQNGAVWQRSVTLTSAGPGRPAALRLGVERRLSAAGPQTDGPNLAMSLAVSAGRAIVQSRTATPASYRLLDRGLVQRVLPIGTWPNTIRVSGDYALVGPQVFTSGGDPVLDLSAQNLQHADLFANRLIYATADGTVRLRDVSKPVSMLTPTTLAAGPPACAADSLDPTCVTDVAIWGDTVAWARRDGTISIRTLPGRAIRQVAVGAWVSDLRLSEGALAWRTPYAGGAAADVDSLRLLDLTSPTSTPVTVSGLTAVSVDDHLLAGVNAAGLITVRVLPFGRSVKYRPRLLGVAADPVFSPVGGVGDSLWSPQIDATKPLTGVRLTLSRGGSPVRVLTGSAPDGSIRDLHWDGLDDAGNPAPAGVYAWALTAAAKDGGGRLTAADGDGNGLGNGLVTGTVRLGR